MEATINLDSTVYGFITDTGRLADTDLLGLSDFDSNDFGNRGLESGQDTIDFAGSSVEISHCLESG